jgi:broad specificity phosphatase PhoE
VHGVWLPQYWRLQWRDRTGISPAFPRHDYHDDPPVPPRYCQGSLRPKLMLTRIWLICAAAPARVTFPGDEPAPPHALKRAAALAQTLPAGPRVFAAPSRRATQTAAAMGLSATPDIALAEANFGRWAGRDPADVMAEEPQGLAAWISDPATAPHDGDSFVTLHTRMSTWLSVRATEGGLIVAITHAGPMRAAVLFALGAPMSAARHIDLSPLDMTQLSHDGLRWVWKAGAGGFPSL